MEHTWTETKLPNWPIDRLTGFSASANVIYTGEYGPCININVSMNLFIEVWIVLHHIYMIHASFIKHNWKSMNLQSRFTLHPKIKKGKGKCKTWVVRPRVLSKFGLDLDQVRWVRPFFLWFEYGIVYVHTALASSLVLCTGYFIFGSVESGVDRC